MPDVILEPERGSIIRFILDKAGLQNYYTDVLPNTFAYPSAYFPTPELKSEHSTLSTYVIHYRMPVRFFAANNQSAYDYALAAATALIAGRNHIPLINADGTESGIGFRVKQSEVEKIDTGVYGFNIEWDSVRLFDDIPDEQQHINRQNHISVEIIS